MSRLDELIAELCPDGVEYKRLGEITKILDNLRKPITRKDRIAGAYPYYGANGIQDYVNDYIFDGTFLLVGEDGSVINKDNSPVLTWAEGKFWVNNHAHVLSEIKEVALLRYIYFSLQNIDVSSIVRGTPPKINQENLKNISIPVPPLPVQQEIVRILDKFTALEAELEAELEARKKQYEYYRDTLLHYNQQYSVQQVKLSEVAQYSRTRIKTSKVSSDNYVGVDNLLPNKRGKVSSNYVPSEGNLIEYRIGDILIGNIRPYLKKIWFATNVGGTNGDVLTIRVNNEFKNELLPKYLYHVLASDVFFDFNVQYSRGAKMPRGNKKAIMNYSFPIPPLAEQERIVAILDRFDALVNDITQGLPAEIEARRKQYEYYRDKLLTFKEAAS